MNDVVRFKMDGEIYLVSDDNGKYVEYDDYAKLEAEAQALRGEVSRLRLQMGIAADIASDPDYEPTVGDSEYDCALHDAIRAMRTKVVVPDWYALVPVEPTREMFIAVNKEDDKAYAGGCDHGAQFDWLWDAALEAAPRLNGKAVSEGLLRRILEFIKATNYQGSIPLGLIAELSDLLGEGKEHE